MDQSKPNIFHKRQVVNSTTPDGPTKSVEDLLKGLVPDPDRIGVRDRSGQQLDNPFTVYEFPADYTYRFVAFNELALTSFLSAGWNFYPAEAISTNPYSGKPWIPFFKNDNGFVLVGDSVMIFTHKRWYEDRRRDNRDRFNRRLEAQKQPEQVSPNIGTPVLVEHSSVRKNVTDDLLGEESEDEE